jgi:uroporphyrin-III C-methyltransferase / precorrin-2 dehydrogenase / sirohydrochlorin ferrochelatase
VVRARGSSTAPTTRTVEDARVAGLAEAAGVLHNIVDNLDGSAFLTAAMVDRDPLVIAIGTEGAAPVLARKVKAHLEERLPATLGKLVKAAEAFRPAAEALPKGARAGRSGARSSPTPSVPARRPRRARSTGSWPSIWAGAAKGPRPLRGRGSRRPDDLTMRARRALDEADVVIHDRLVPGAILELARREAEILDVGKTGFGPSTPQEHINALIVEHARTARSSCG